MGKKPDPKLLRERRESIDTLCRNYRPEEHGLFVEELKSLQARYNVSRDTILSSLQKRFPKVNPGMYEAYKRNNRSEGRRTKHSSILDAVEELNEADDRRFPGEERCMINETAEKIVRGKYDEGRDEY